MERALKHELPSFIDLSNQLQNHHSTDIMHLRYFLDARMKQTSRASRNCLSKTTPYRYSFRKPDDQLKAKPLRTRKQAPRDSAQKETRLPRLPTNCESLVNVAVCKCWQECTGEDVDNLSAKGKESITATRGFNKRSANSVKDEMNEKTTITSCNLPSIHPESDDSGISDISANDNGSWLDTLLRKLREDGQETEGEFSRVMADGSRVTATQRKLYLEVFLPRM